VAVIGCVVTLPGYSAKPAGTSYCLIEADGTEAKKCEYYSYSQCHDRLCGEFHCDYVFCSDALSRNSFHPPPELKEVIL